MLLKGGKLMYNKTYIDDCLNGEATIFNLDEYIEYWHTHETGNTLREFIGLTEYEYEQWGNNSDIIIRDILRCRMEHIDFESYQSLDENERLAARSYNQKDIDKLKKDNNE